MALGVPYEIVSGAQAAGSTTFQLTITHDVAAGDCVYVGTGWNANNTAPTCTDSKGQTYNLAQTPDTAQTSKGAQFVLLNSVAMTSGVDWIKVTYTGTSASQGIIAMGCSGVATASAIDAAPAGNDASSGTSPASNATGTLAQASEWIVGLLVNGNAGGVPSAWSGGFTAVDSVQNGSNQHTSVASQVVSSTASVTAGAAISSTNWCCLMVSLKAAAPAVTTPAPEPPQGGPAWRRRFLRHQVIPPPPPVPAGAAPVTTLPAAIIDLRVELLLGQLGWTDISSYVLQNRSGPGVTITRGHADESTSATPAGMTMYLRNADGRFTDGNPTGPYYGYIGQNTNVRVSVPEGASYLRIEGDQLSYASTPGATAPNVTGDIDVRLDITLDNWNANQLLAGKWVSAGNQQSWVLYLNEAGTLVFAWSADGAAVSGAAISTVAVTPPALRRMAVRATLAVATGTVTFYTAPAAIDQVASGPITSGWVQLGAPVVIAATSIFASAAEIDAGYVPGALADISGYTGIFGKVHSLQVLAGIGGTAVASPDFTAAGAGLSSFSDGQGNVWAVQGTAEISARRYRFHGEVAAWPQGWDTSGTDVYVAVAAGGLLRRLSQRNKPLYSALRRYWTLAAVSVQAFWPCEDQAGSTSIATGVPGGYPMVFTASSPTLAADSSFASSGAIPQIQASTWQGTVASYADTGTIVVRFIADLPVTGTAAGGTVLQFVTTGTAAAVVLSYSGDDFPQNLFLNGYTSAGAAAWTFGNLNMAAPSGTCLISIELTSSGGTVTPTLRLMPLSTGSQPVLSATISAYAGTTGAVTNVFVDPVQDAGGNPGIGHAGGSDNLPATAVGHIAVQSALSALATVLSGPLQAWFGETAANRFARLCSENGIACRIQGNADGSVLMGTQTQESFTTLLQECADADRGVIFEPRQVTGLGYRCSASLQNQSAGVALDYSQAHLSPPVSPTRDDQNTRNDVTVTRTGGSSSEAIVSSGPMSTAEPPSGVGTYDTQVTINLASDGQLPSLAGWLAHMGTVDQPRYPSLAVDLSRSEVAGIYYDLQDLDLGDRLTVASTPGFLPPDGISQLLQGETVSIGGYIYTIAANCVPETPWRTLRVGDHIDTDGSTLWQPAGAADTTLYVASSGALWTTSAGDFPFDIVMAGERITVTNCTGAASPQAMTVTRSVNGVSKAHLAGEPLSLFTPAIVPLT